MTIQSKTFALLERDYVRVHPPGAVVTQAALAWLGEVAETLAKLTEERDAALRPRADNTKRDKLAQRFAAAMLTDSALRVEPDRLRELAYGYADAFYPESDR